MNDREQIQAFADDLDKLVARYADEFDLSYAAAIGVLQIKSFALMARAKESYEEEQDEEGRGKP